MSTKIPAIAKIVLGRDGGKENGRGGGSGGGNGGRGGSG